MTQTRSATLPSLIRPAALFCAVAAILSLIGLALDPRLVTGVPVWLKPLKFSVSILIMLWTYRQYWPWIHKQSRVRLVYQLSAVMLVSEMILILIQAARGVPSHFNLTTSFDMAVFSAMGAGIGVFWVGALFLLVAFFKTKPDPMGLVWAARLGLIVGIIGMGMAWKMTGPTASQIQEIQSHQSPVGGIWGGAHSVGVAEDAPGAPVTGWKLSGGDLRVAHFLGMHAMQILWILALVLARFAPRLHRPMRLGLLSGVFLALLAMTLWQYVRALNGQPFV